MPEVRGLVLALAVTIDALSVGPDSIRDRVAFFLAVPATILLAISIGPAGTGFSNGIVALLTPLAIFAYWRAGVLMRRRDATATL